MCGRSACSAASASARESGMKVSNGLGYLMRVAEASSCLLVDPALLAVQGVDELDRLAAVLAQVSGDRAAVRHRAAPRCSSRATGRPPHPPTPAPCARAAYRL